MNIIGENLGLGSPKKKKTMKNTMMNTSKKHKTQRRPQKN